MLVHQANRFVDDIVKRFQFLELACLRETLPILAALINSIKEVYQRFDLGGQGSPGIVLLYSFFDKVAVQVQNLLPRVVFVCSMIDHRVDFAHLPRILVGASANHTPLEAV